MWASATRGFEDIEQGDGGRENRSKSGILVSDSELEELVRQASAAMASCPCGLVVGAGPVEPAGWRELWRELLRSPPGTVFCWRNSSEGREELKLAAAEAEAVAAAAAAAAQAAADTAEATAKTAAATAASGNIARSQARLPQCRPCRCGLSQMQPVLW